MPIHIEGRSEEHARGPDNESAANGSSELSPEIAYDSGHGRDGDEGYKGSDQRRASPEEPYSPDFSTLVADVVQQPTKAFGYLASTRAEHVGVSLVIYVLSQVPRSWLQNPFGFASPVARFVGNTVFNISTLVFAVALLHLSAKMLGGRNRYSKMLQAEAVSSLPYLLTAPLLVIASLMDSSMSWNLINGAASIWTLGLSVIAIRQVYSFSTGRAVAALFMPAIVIFGIGLLLTILATALSGGAAL